MRNDENFEIEVDEETYEIKAIKAHIAGELSIKDLQASLELSRAHTYRRVALYKKHGAKGLESRKIGLRNNAYPAEERDKIMTIVRNDYPDFGPTLASEKLWQNHHIRIAVETLRTWMIEDKLWTDRMGRKPRIFSPRPPRERRGELVQVDGSYHRWFEKRGDACCLIVFIDDATSELKELRFVEHETSYNYMSILKRYIDRFGRPLALFSDRHSIFRATSPQTTGERTPTQFARACRRLDIEIICAKTPQAKGRVERANRTLQDRLVKELRLRNISTFQEANIFLEEYRLDHNEQFARLPADPADAHLPKPNEDLDALLTYTVERKVFKDLTLSFNKMRLMLENSEEARRAIGKKVTVAVSLDGHLEVLFDETALPYRVFDKIRRISDGPLVTDSKRLGSAFALAKTICENEPHHFQRNRHVMAGFRKHFENPDDPRSRALRDAPPEVRRRHNYRPRAPLAAHPVVVLKSRLAEVYSELHQEYTELSNRPRPPSS